MPDVPHDFLNEAAAQDVVTLFLEPECAAETSTGCARRLRLAHTRADEVTRHRLDVKRHLLIHLAIAGAPSEERDQAAEERGGRRVISGSLFERAQYPRDGAREPQPPVELGLRSAAALAGNL